MPRDTIDVVGSLRDRLDRLHRGAGLGPARRAERTADEREVAASVAGAVIAPGLVLIEEEVPFGARSGAVAFAELDPGVVANLGVQTAEAPQSLAFLDTETTGLAGGTGTLVFLLGVAHASAGHLLLRQYLLLAPRGERDMLLTAGTFAERGDVLVTYNGRAFDLPLLATRCVMARCVDRFAPRCQLDLLSTIRCAFKRRWFDCRLQSAERYLLGSPRVDDLPGREVPSAWHRWLCGGDQGDLLAVLRHNRRDVLALVALLIRLGTVFSDPFDPAEPDRVRVARALSRQGGPVQALRYLRAAAATLDEEGWLLLAELHRSAGDDDGAIAIWERLAQQGCSPAQLALAKYHEHRSRDLVAALRLTEALLARHGPLPELQWRRRRLHARLSRARTCSVRHALARLSHTPN